MNFLQFNNMVRPIRLTRNEEGLDEDPAPFSTIYCEKFDQISPADFQKLVSVVIEKYDFD